MNSIQSVHEDDSSFPGPERQLILQLEDLEDELHYLMEFFPDCLDEYAECNREIEKIKQELCEKYGIDITKGKNVPMMYNDSDTLQNPRRTFIAARDIFHKELDRWITDLLNDCHGDYYAAVSELCQVMCEKFHTPPKKLKDVAKYLDENLIEHIIVSLSKEFDFKYSRVSHPTNDIKNEWLLIKKKHGYRSELSIQLFTENYIHICSGTDGWNLFAYAYHILESAINSWVNGCM